MIKDVAAWLKKSPPKGQVAEIQNGDKKVKIIPQNIIETLLDELTEQNWSTRNFKMVRWTEVLPSKSNEPVRTRTICDAHLELVVTYRTMADAPLHTGTGPLKMEREITRVLVGAYSFDCSLFGNDYIANTAKSLCIVNAASELGRRFGKDLNPKEDRMLIMGIKNPVDVGSSTGKIGETLDKINNKK